MAFLSSLAHALRGSAEGAVAHLRPPGPLKPRTGHLPGGNAPGRSRPQCHARPDTFRCSKQAHAPYQNVHRGEVPNAFFKVFSYIVKHALTPVFVGLRTGADTEGALQTRRMVGSFCRSAESKSFTRSRVRPTGQAKSYSEYEISKDLAQASSRFRQDPNMVPNSDMLLNTDLALGFRAAFDQLKEENRKKGRTSESRKSRKASACRNLSCSSSSLRYSWNAAQQMGDLERTASSLSMEMYVGSSDTDNEWLCSMSTPSCFTCSSSDDVSQISDYDLQSRHENADAASQADSEEDDDVVFFAIPRPQTILRIPYNLDLAILLAAEPHPQWLCLLDKLKEIIEMQADYRMRIFAPIRQALEMGHLSRYRHRPWEMQLIANVDDEGRIDPLHAYHVFTVVFEVGNPTEVLEALRQDLPTWSDRWLQSLVFDYVEGARSVPDREDTIREGPFSERNRRGFNGNRTDTGSLNLERSVSLSANADPSADSLERTVATSSEDGLVDIVALRDENGEASRLSEQEHGQGYTRMDCTQLRVAGMPVAGTSESIDLHMPLVSVT